MISLPSDARSLATTELWFPVNPVSNVLSPTRDSILRWTVRGIWVWVHALSEDSYWYCWWILQEIEHEYFSIGIQCITYWEAAVDCGETRKMNKSAEMSPHFTISRSSPKSYDVCSVYLALREVQWRSHDMIRHPTPRTHQGPSKKGTTAGVIIGPLTKTTMASATWREFTKMIRLCAGVLRDIGSIFAHFEFTDNASLLTNKQYLI